ncbi:MAG: nitrogen regulation protein NR(II) [Phycisphaerales bacterium JB040]
MSPTPESNSAEGMVPPATAVPALNVFYVTGPRREDILARLPESSHLFRVIELEHTRDLPPDAARRHAVLLLETTSPAALKDTPLPTVLVSDAAPADIPPIEHLRAIHPDDLAGLPAALLEASAHPSDEIRLDELQEIVRLRKIVIRTRTYQQALHASFEHLGGMLPVTHAEVWTPAHDGRTLELTAQWQPDHQDPDLPNAMRAALARVEIDHPSTLPATAWRTHLPIIVTDLASSPIFARRDLAAERGLQAAVAMAALDGDTPHAVLVFFLDRDSLSPAVVRSIRSTVSQLGDLLHFKGFEQQAAESRELVAKTFDSIDDAVFVVSTNDRRVLDCNNAAATMFGYDKSEIIGECTDTLHPSPDDWRRFGRLSKDEIERRGAYRGTHSMRRKDGTTFQTEHHVTTLSTPNGEPRAVVSVIRDRTREAAFDAELDRLRSELTHVSRVATLGQLSAGVIHTLSNPLNSLESRLAAAQHLQDQSDGNPELRTAIRESRRELDRLGDFLQQLRRFMKKRRPERHPLDANRVAHEALQLVRHTAERAGVSLESDLDPDAPQILADRVQLEQVIVALVQNSIDALADTDPPRTVRVSTRSEHRGVAFRVSDNGPGLKLEEPVAVRPFESTKEKGLGLGLAISRYIVQAHDGELQFERSRPHPTVRFTIPTGDTP